MPNEIGFNTKKYLKHQAERIKEVVEMYHDKLYIEFGGKIVHDKHAARVLPGYDENAKLELIKKLCRQGELIFVVSAKDICRSRVRGDFKITYDKETFRVLSELRKRGLKVKNVVISMVDASHPLFYKIKNLEKRLQKEGFNVYRFTVIANYPKRSICFDNFLENPFVRTRKKLVAIISPGGGSGKFGVCLSQLFHELRAGNMPSYLKFETFPVHDLPIKHPLNLAFMAASADFYDVVMRDYRHGKATSYNRDLENFELLNLLAKKFPENGKHLLSLLSATNMGINMLTRGIVNDEVVQKEAAAEIARRLIRYKFEVSRGEEKPEVLKQVRNVLEML